MNDLTAMDADSMNPDANSSTSAQQQLGHPLLRTTSLNQLSTEEKVGIGHSADSFNGEENLDLPRFQRKPTAPTKDGRALNISDSRSKKYVLHGNCPLQMAHKK